MQRLPHGGGAILLLYRKRPKAALTVICTNGGTRLLFYTYAAAVIRRTCALEIGMLHQVDEHADALQIGADQNALVRPVNA